jgi:hypothetical protein
LSDPEACRFVADRVCWRGESGCKSKGACGYWKWTDDAKAAKAKRAAVRTFPMPVWPPEARPANWCRWCGDQIVHGRAKERSWHDGRLGEPECKIAWQLHTDRRVQFSHVEARDGLECWDCKEAPEKWLRGAECFIGGTGEFTDREGVVYVCGTRYQNIERVTALELEHSIPLWLISHLPDDERRPYFGPKNLRLRCPTCHTAKTRREASERGKTNRLAKGPKESRHKLQGGGKLPGKGQGPKMKSRPFPKGGRPLQSRNSFRG